MIFTLVDEEDIKALKKDITRKLDIDIKELKKDLTRKKKSKKQARIIKVSDADVDESFRNNLCRPAKQSPARNDVPKHADLPSASGSNMKETKKERIEKIQKRFEKKKRKIKKSDVDHEAPPVSKSSKSSQPPQKHDKKSLEILESAYERSKYELEMIEIFSRECVLLLKTSNNFQMDFHKFSDAYRQYFDQSIKVEQYGCKKLIELFDAISNKVKIVEKRDERIIELIEKPLKMAPLNYKILEEIELSPTELLNDKKKSNTFDYNEESNRTSKASKTSKKDTKCFEFKFTGSEKFIECNQEKIYVHRFEMEISNEVAKILNEDKVELKLVPTRTTSQFEIIDKYVKFQASKIPEILSTSVSFYSNHVKA